MYKKQPNINVNINISIMITKRICMHKTKFLMNIFKYCLKKGYIKQHEFANCNSANYNV